MTRTVGSNFPLIGVDNWLRRGSVVTATDSAPNAYSGATWDYWDGGVLSFVLPTAAVPEYFAVAAHTLGSAGAEIELSNGSDTVTLAPSDDETTGILIDGDHHNIPATATNWTITKTGGLVGVIGVGVFVEIPCPIYENFRPFRWAAQSDIRPRVSANGQYLGKTINRRGRAGDFRVRNIPARWPRDVTEEIDLLATEPFFLWWRPDGYPTEVSYCWTDEPPEVENTGPAGRVTFRARVSAYAP